MEKNYTQDELLRIINQKANIFDIYTKLEIEKMLLTKADSNNVYPKDDILRMLSNKLDKSESYDKTYLNGNFCRKTDYLSKTEILALLDEKMPESYVYTVDEINKLLNLKRNNIDSYTKTEIDSMFKNYSGGSGGNIVNPDLATDTIAGTIKTGKAFGELSLNADGIASVNGLTNFKQKTESDILALQQSGGGGSVISFNNYVGRSDATKDQVESDKTILDQFAIQQGFKIEKGLLCDTVDQYRYRCAGQNGHWVLDSYIFDVSSTNDGYLTFSNGNAKVNGFENLKTQISLTETSVNELNIKTTTNSSEISKIKELLGNVDPQNPQTNILDSILKRLDALESRTNVVFIDQGTTEDQLKPNTVGIYK